MTGLDVFWQKILATAEVLDELDYYELLGVPRDAGVDTIRRVYYDLVRKLHPDKHAGETEPGRQKALVVLYARVGEAYRVLSAPAKRAAYAGLLAQGKKRLPRGHELPRPEDQRDPRTERARSLYDRGRELLAGGDKRGARAQWELAIQFEPDSRALRAALDELDQKPTTASHAPVVPAGPAASLGAGAPPSTPSPSAGAATAATTIRASALAAATPGPSRRATTLSPYPAELSARDLAGARGSHMVTVKCSSMDQVVALYRRKLLAGSLVVRTSHVPPTGSPVTLNVRLPDGQTIAVAGMVAGGDTRAGMRLTIATLAADVRAVFDAIAGEAPATGEHAAQVAGDSGARTSAPGDSARIGWQALRAGDAATAADAFAAALAARPDDARTRAAWYLALAELARREGRDRDAALHRQTALAFDPDCEREPAARRTSE